MAQAGNDADDLAVSLTWADEATFVPAPAGASPQSPVARRQPRPAPPAPDERTPRPSPPRAAPAAGPDPKAGARAPGRTPSLPALPTSRRTSAPPARPAAPAHTASRSPSPPGASWAGPEPRRSGPPVDEPSPKQALLDILEHLSTLSHLVTGTSRAQSAELEALGARVEKAVGDLDALQLRVVRSLAGFDVLRLRVHKELSDRPPLTDEDVARIADAVTARLLDHVRVETEDRR